MKTPEDCLTSTATEWGSSRWSEFRRCQKAHYLRYELGVERKPAEPQDDDDDRNTKIDYFAVGQLTHACLEWTSLAAKDGTQASWKDIIATASNDNGERKAFDVGVVYEVERLVSAYFSHYGEENGGWPEGVRVVDVEIELGEPPLQRRADVILELPSGELVVGDTKTRAHAIPDARFRFIEDMQTNDQFLGLSFLAQKHYKLSEPPAVWVNAIIKTKVPKFDRVLVPFDEEIVQRWRAEQEEWELEFNSAHADPGNHALANYSSCAPPIGSRCTYFYYCHGSQEKREQYFQITSKKAA